MIFNGLWLCDGLTVAPHNLISCALLCSPLPLSLFRGQRVRFSSCEATMRCAAKWLQAEWHTIYVSGVECAHHLHNTIDEFISASSHLNKFMIDLFYLAMEMRLGFITFACARCVCVCVCLHSHSLILGNEPCQMNITIPQMRSSTRRKWLFMTIFFSAKRKRKHAEREGGRGRGVWRPRSSFWRKMCGVWYAHGNGNEHRVKSSLWFFVWFWLWPTTKYSSVCKANGDISERERERPKDDDDGEEEKPIIRLSSLYRALRVPSSAYPSTHPSASEKPVLRA